MFSRLSHTTTCLGVCLLSVCPCGTSCIAAEMHDKQFAVVYTPSAPVIDGVIDDPEWGNAAVIDDFHEVEPVEYSAPKEKVRVRVLYDEDNLYIAVEIEMRHVDDITAFRLAQGSDIQNEDRFKVVIDPYNDQRRGYDFRINPNGVREEGLFGLIGRPNTDWNGIWDGHATLTDTGWTAELAIPFKTLNFDPDNATWAISFSTNISARNEQIAWTSRNKVTRPGTLGAMTGITRARQGRGVDLVPSLTLRQSRNFAAGTETFDVVPSLDLFYKLTPQLTAAFTVNTDFSAAEVDDRVVNLERFPVFFPEKRAFFLQDADLFSFADLEDNGIPFFSRRIGLDDNRQPVDLRGGAKLTGRVGPVNLGILNVIQDAGDDSANLFVGRGIINVLNMSTLGLIVTDGSPDTTKSNSVIGTDFNYINRSFLQSKGVQANLWYVRSNTRGIESGEDAYGFVAKTFRARGFFGELRHRRIGTNYAPALGFVNRAGIRDYALEFGYFGIVDNDMFQSFQARTHAAEVTDLDGNTESREIVLEPLDIVGKKGDSLAARFVRQTEVLTAPFEISDGIVIATGRYDWNRTELSISTGDQRAIVVDGLLASGDFYDGRRRRFDANVTWQPSKYFSLGAGFDYNDIRLASGDFMTRLITTRADIAFSSTLSWSTLAQYDNRSDELSLNSRLRWIPRAGREVLLVVNHGWLVNEPMLDRRRVWRSLTSGIILKASYTLRY